MVKVEDEIFFVHVKEPVEIRKSILEGSKQIVQLLQRYEIIRQVRLQKVEQVTNLRKNFKDLVVLVNKLKQEMPKVNARLNPKQETSSPSKKGIGTKKGKSVSPSAVQKLEDELKMIESKLNTLS
ncbi:hypothetical protein ACFL96_16385 [Thermoproteota archaeon]